VVLAALCEGDDWEELWRDGLAIVYRVRTRSGDTFTLKTQPSAGGANCADSFQRECAVGAQLQHPHALPLRDSGDAGGDLYQILPPVDDNLEIRLSRSRTLAIAEALRITHRIALALAHMHDRNLVHCNVKPAAIWFTRDEPMLTDFSLSRRLGERVSDTPFGTPAYMSPEQAQPGTEIDGRSDLYSLGCVLYEAFAGTPPFRGWDLAQAIAAHRLQTPRPVTDLRPEVPTPVQEVIRRSLAKSPVDRFQTAAAMANALVTA
jgi:serine/threonine-protein kinase